MKTHFKKSEYFLAGVLAFVAAFPLVTDISTLHSDVALAASTLSSDTIRQQALGHFQEYRSNRRDFQKSQELCLTLQKQGKDVTCPEVNDLTGIQVFLSTHTNKVVAPSFTGSVIRSMVDLNTLELNLMRRYQNIHTCPDTMKSVPGFYELCQSLLTPLPRLQQKAIERKVITGPQGTKGSDDATLDDLIKVNKGVKRTW